METEQDRYSKLQSQIQSLRSGNRSAILSTLQELRSHGNVSVLPVLFDLMLDQEDAEVNQAISSLLNDLKDQECAETLSAAIGNPELKEIQPTLVAACWQNGLSYVEYLDIFLEVVIKGEFNAAIEAFTVVEEAMGDLEKGQRDLLAKEIKIKVKDADDQKKLLLSELIKVISDY